MSAAEWVGYQLAVHPKLHRVTLLCLATHLLALWSVVAAPPALASTMAGALDWAGLADSHGIPPGAYYLSVASTTEVISKAGPHLSAKDPSSWMTWGAYAITSGITHDTMASWLQAQASLYIAMLTFAVWLLRFAMSSTWLYWLATWFRPLLEILRRLLVDLLVFPICLTLGLGVGAWHILGRGHRGRGWGLMISAVAIGALGLVLTRDPLNELYSDNGLLTKARNLGFSAAQAAMYNHSIGAGATGQMQHLTGALLDAMLRAPLQIHNFGMVIDGVGNCGSAWDTAIRAGQPDGPAHAMRPLEQGGCGAASALSYAQHLDGSNFAVGILLGLLGLAFSFFIVYLAYSYVMVACAAFVTGIMALFTAGPAMIAGHPRRRAARRLKEFFKHVFRVFVYVTYASLAAVVILRIAAPGGYAAQVNMTHPVALLMLVALASVIATGLFWWLKRELGDHTRSDLIHSVRDVGDAVRSGYDRGQQAYGRGRAFYERGRERLSRRGGGANSGGGDGDSRGGGDEPLTGRPVGGRPPGGRPASNGPRRTAQAAATVGGKVVGPEAAVVTTMTETATAGAGRVTQQDSSARRDGSSSSSDATVQARRSSPDSPPPEPVSGRDRSLGGRDGGRQRDAGRAQSKGQRRDDSSVSHRVGDQGAGNQDHPDAPVRGRS